MDYLLPLTLALKIVIAALLLSAAVRDIMTRTVPNWIPLSLAMFSAASAAANFRLFWGLGFGLTIFLACIVCWHRGWMGGADVKLLGGAAVVVAPSDIETFLLAVTLSGGVLALAYLAGRFVLPRPAARRPKRLLARVLRVEAWRIRHHGPLPYACAIAAGTLFVLS
jgi:prepilin peptidase CpaA